MSDYDPLSPEEIEELRADPRMVHLYDGHRIVALLLAATPAAGIDVDDLRHLVFAPTDHNQGACRTCASVRARLGATE